MVFLCMAGTDIIGDNRLKIIHGRRKMEKNFRLGSYNCFGSFRSLLGAFAGCFPGFNVDAGKEDATLP